MAKLICQKCGRGFNGRKGTAWCDNCKFSMLNKARIKAKEDMALIARTKRLNKEVSKGR